MKHDTGDRTTLDHRAEPRAPRRTRFAGFACTIALISLLVAAPAAPADAREFLNTFMHFNFNFSYNQVYAALLRAERREPLLLDLPYFAQIDRPTHYSYSFGIFADIVPFPAVMFNEDRSAIKFGLRAGYRFNSIRQTLAVKKPSGNYYKKRSNLFTSEAPLFGPVIRFAPVVKEDPVTHEYTARWGITLFAMYGRLVNARLNGRPNIMSGTSDVASYMSMYLPATTALSYYQQEYAKLVSLGFPSANVSGDRIEVGMGGEVGIFYFNLGVNLVYSKVWLKQSFRTHFTVPKSTQMQEFMAEIYLGLPVEWSFIPTTN